MNWRCLIGLHDWDEFGECRRNWKHIQSWGRDIDYIIFNGPHDRVMRSRHSALVHDGRVLQDQMRALGQDVSLELCKDMVRTHRAEELLAYAAERHALGLH